METGRSRKLIDRTLTTYGKQRDKRREDKEEEEEGGGREQEVGHHKPSKPALLGALPLARFHLLKLPELSQIAPPTGSHASVQS